MIPRAMLDVMNILKEASKGQRTPEFLATHPLPETRLDQIQAEIKEAYPNGIPSNLTKGRAPAASGRRRANRVSASRNGRSSPLLLPIVTFQVTLTLEAAEISQRLLQRFDRLAGDAPGVVELAEQLQVVEELRSLELPPESCARAPSRERPGGPCDVR